jgi:hypothetical protein
MKMNAKLAKVTRRLVPLATAFVATALVMNKVKSGLNENSTDVEVRVTRMTAAMLGVVTFGAVATITADVIDDLTTDEVKNVVEVITNEVK